MKRLTLVRHAQAKVQDAQVSDFERPLSRRGKADAKASARTLFGQALIPNLLIASAARRTRQTAEIFAAELAIPERQVRFDEALYLASAATLLQAIQATGPRIEHLLLVGHNPGVSELANALAPRAELGEFATAAACTMQFDVRAWPAVILGAALEPRLESPTPRLFGLLR